MACVIEAVPSVVNGPGKKSIVPEMSYMVLGHPGLADRCVATHPKASGISSAGSTTLWHFEIQVVS